MIVISDSVWDAYIKGLSKINKAAGQKMNKYLSTTEWFLNNQSKQAAIEYAYALATEYGEAATALACEMYDAIMAASMGEIWEPAVPAATASYADVAKAINGTAKYQNNDLTSNAIARLVKMAGADTTLYNAIRDGAEWAWIPRGDTCAFCITLASRGWQRASKKALKNGHAEHIHANCDCTYAVRFDGESDVEGYNPDVYKKMYYGQPESSPKAKINSMRREIYAENKDRINEQKRVAYQKRKELESSQAEETDIT